MEQLMSNKNRNLLLTGQFISLLGNSIQRFALSLYILDLTGSVAVFSALTAFSVLPQIFISPIGVNAEQIATISAIIFPIMESGMFFCTTVKKEILIIAIRNKYKNPIPAKI